MKLRTLAVMMLGMLLLGACVKLPELPPAEEPQKPAEEQMENITLDLVLPVSDGKTTWKSADYKGKPVLVAVMATWCPWCKKSLDALDKTSAAYAGKAEVVGIFIENDLAPVEQVKKDYQIKSKILYNGRPAAETLGVQGFPHIILFDKNHKAVRTWSGFSPTLADQYAAELDKLLK